MDPGACLDEMIEIASAGDPDRLSELVLALDGWMRQGGFIPERWQTIGRIFRAWDDEMLRRVVASEPLTRMERAVQASALLEMDARKRERMQS
jgi:hypothetical protein